MLTRADAQRIPLRDGVVQCIVTSPPYWGLRDYKLGATGIGLEPTLDAYLENMRQVARECWRVLRPDGVMFLNLGDCYAGSGGENANSGLGLDTAEGHGLYRKNPRKLSGLKPKDLVGLPWRVAFALQADGWWLRSDIIWAKPNPMPESVTDRPTRAHEYIFLLTKQPRYYYDAEAVKEATIDPEYSTVGKVRPSRYEVPMANGADYRKAGSLHNQPGGRPTRNRRTVWAIPTEGFGMELCKACGTVYWPRDYRRLAEHREENGVGRICDCGRWDAWSSHFAVFPEKLVEPCVLAGSSPKACGVCGAPWERVVEREVKPPPDRRNNNAFKHDAMTTHGEGAATLRNIVERETLGWRPTCDHNDDTGKCIVLDPFCGSGTTGVVAQKHGRRFVGLDLSADYLRLAEKRIGAAPVGLGW